MAGAAGNHKLEHIPFGRSGNVGKLLLLGARVWYRAARRGPARNICVDVYRQGEETNQCH